MHLDHDEALILNRTTAIRRSGTALLAATHLGDALAGSLATLHLHGNIRQLCSDLEMIKDTAPDIIVLVSIVLEKFTARLSGFTFVVPSETQRLLRWSSARLRSLARVPRDPDLFETIANRGRFGMTDLRHLHAMECNFTESQLCGSMFDGGAIEGCDFRRAGLMRSTWREAHVHHSNFSGADLTDVVLDDAVFIGCDLRGANLATVNGG
ncbi:MAG: pentapeptide repeat-containing protein, partial [Deltaproteobacteria bacterium]